ILDFYAGSGTIADAAKLLYNIDGGSRHTLSFTLNEVRKYGHHLSYPSYVFHEVLISRIRVVSTGLTAAKAPVTGEYEFPSRGVIADGLEGVIEVLVPEDGSTET